MRQLLCHLSSLRSLISRVTETFHSEDAAPHNQHNEKDVAVQLTRLSDNNKR